MLRVQDCSMLLMSITGRVNKKIGFCRDRFKYVGLGFNVEPVFNHKEHKGCTKNHGEKVVNII